MLVEGGCTNPTVIAIALCLPKFTLNECYQSLDRLARRHASSNARFCHGHRDKTREQLADIGIHPVQHREIKTVMRGGTDSLEAGRIE